MNDILLAIGGLITTGGAALFGWLFGRRKTAAEAEGLEANAKTTEIDNEIKLSEYYKTLLDDLKPRYEKQFRDFESACQSKEKLLKEEILILRKENRILKAQVAQKDTELKAKTKRILELESKK
ncbi:MAG: hypothetical protein U1C58_06315 [Flavobacteriaceae bacterium]|nr:hypothetical protein [Flavobacteriaceae bacterium]